MKLDVTCMRFLTRDDYRVLTAVEMGMRNHEMVPVSLITSIAGLRHGGSYKILSTLLRYKLVAHTNAEYDGYRLSYMGFDILALHTLLMRGVITSLGSQIGVGKESDIFEALDEDGNEVVVKIHRLGRTSFRAVRRTRDYMVGKSKASWLYMSRLAAVKEFAFMKALYAHNFPTPVPIDHCRHIVVMSRVRGFPLAQITSGQFSQEYSERLFKEATSLVRKLASHGLVHCDFNEFNIMVVDEKEAILRQEAALKARRRLALKKSCGEDDHDNDHDDDHEDSGEMDDEEASGFNIVTMIDFPQMVSTAHYNAEELFDRDMNGLIKFFAMKLKYSPGDLLDDDSYWLLRDIVKDAAEKYAFAIEQSETTGVAIENIEGFVARIDEEVKASGFDEELGGNIMDMDLMVQRDDDNDDDEENSDDEDDSEKEDDKPVDKVLESQWEEKKRQDALTKLRESVLRKNKGQGKQTFSKGNQTKKRNKYGRIVRDNVF